MNPTYLCLLYLGVTILLLSGGTAMWLQRRPRLAIAALLPGVLGLALAGYSAWFNFLRRPPSPQAVRELHPGLTYQRLVGRYSSGEPCVAHVARWQIGHIKTSLKIAANPISLDSMGRHNLRATLPSTLLEESGGLFLINGDFFGPWKDNGPLDFLPRAGDTCASAGPTRVDGELVVMPDVQALDLWTLSAKGIQVHIQDNVTSLGAPYLLSGRPSCGKASRLTPGRSPGLTGSSATPAVWSPRARPGAS